MMAQTSESVLHSITPAVCDDKYYAGKTNTEAQCFGAIQDNRFIVSLPSVSQGSTSQIIFNPNQGLSDIVITAQLPPAAGTVWTGYAMPAGWLAAMVNTVALRVGGSSLYYWTGDQILLDTLGECETLSKKNGVFSAAGAALTSAAQFTTSGSVSNLDGSIYLKMPFNSISALQKTLPLPTDLLTQPVTILITWKNFSDVAFQYATGGTLPTAFASVVAQFRQTTLINSEHLLSRREPMNDKMLVVPLRHFAQTTFRTTQPVTAGQAVQLNLTGLRAGSIKYIDIWATSATAASGNPFNFVPLISAQLLVNGLVYYDSTQYNTQLWNLCESKVALAIENNSVLSSSASPITSSTTCVATASSPPWLRISFAQLCEPVAYSNDLTLGLTIANSVVNLNLVFPVSDTLQINAAYHYACNLIATKGTMEYLFT